MDISHPCELRWMSGVHHTGETGPSQPPLESTSVSATTCSKEAVHRPTISSAASTSLLARCLICNNEVSLTLSVADRYDALSIIQRLLSTPAARHTHKQKMQSVQ